MSIANMDDIASVWYPTKHGQERNDEVVWLRGSRRDETLTYTNKTKSVLFFYQGIL